MTPRIHAVRDRCVELVFIAAFASLVATGCHPANSARGVADRFIDQYYVAIDLKAAEPFCTGLALDKLHKEMQLIGNQRTDELDGFSWYCEKCGNCLYLERVAVHDIVSQLPGIFSRFFSSPGRRTCKVCGTVMPAPSPGRSSPL